MNGFLFTKLQPVFRVPQFPPNIPFLPQDCVSILQCIWSPCPHCPQPGPQFSLVFCGCDSFKEHLSGIAKISLCLGLPGVFWIDRGLVCCRWYWGACCWQEALLTWVRPACQAPAQSCCFPFHTLPRPARCRGRGVCCEADPMLNYVRVGSHR